jgi:aspartyl/glutamyl-tRNA(Asn/Gln) amidotransferase C subunit
MNKEDVFTKELVDSLADKLLIGLTEEENNTVLEEFSSIKANMDLINEIPNISSVKPQSYPFDITVSPREDIVEESIDIKDILSNCDQFEEREVEVPKVVG